jgi:two-component system cell cycle response regulator CtrA
MRVTLTGHGYEVDDVTTGEAALEALRAHAFDLVLLDMNMPGLGGIETCRLIRAQSEIAIIVLTVRDGEADKVGALDAGADDYVTKPFHRDELVARIHAIVRRSKGHSQSVIRTGKLAVNLDAKTVEVDGSRVHLTGKEYAMLELLSLRKGTTLTKEMFLNHLYGGMDEPELKIIDVFICKLRKKLSLACGGANYIETVWGRGYVLRDPDEASEPEPQAAVA